MWLKNQQNGATIELLIALNPHGVHIFVARKRRMSLSMNKNYAPGLSETVAAAVIATDDSKLGHLLAMALREAGVAVKEAQSFDAINADDVQSKLFIIDDDLKVGGNSMKFFRYLRSQQMPEKPALVLLSRSSSVAAYDAGVDVVLSKPVSVPLFMARIRSVLRRYQIIL